MALKKICAKVGCNNLTDSRYCADHQQQAHAYDQHRGSSAERGYGAKWRQARAYYLKRHPLCVDCERENKLTPAAEVDHIIPHRGDMKLFWDKQNWQGLCKSHHSRKTASGR